MKDAQRLLSDAHALGSERILQTKIDFLQLPIPDGGVASDQAIHRLASDCCDRVLRGEKLYIHCWGGHGRTGTLVSIVVGRLYGLKCGKALKFCQMCHDSRLYPQSVRSPQTVVQRSQVRRHTHSAALRSLFSCVQRSLFSCSLTANRSDLQVRRVLEAQPLHTVAQVHSLQAHTPHGGSSDMSSRASRRESSGSLASADTADMMLDVAPSIDPSTGLLAEVGRCGPCAQLCLSNA